MRTQQFAFSGFGDRQLASRLWLPEGEVKGILQIVHGMTEHMGRYENLAEALLPQGIVVAGFDLRGHGGNPGDPNVASLGEGGWEATLEDMRLFYQWLGQRFPGVQRYLYGFSLGSFLVREYLDRYPEGIAGAVIVGTGHQPGWLLGIMRGIVAGQVKQAGFDKTTDLVRQLSFGAYNQKFKPNRTDADWLCGDAAALNAYLADPLVRKDISAGLFWELLGAMQRTGRADACRNWKKDMPILLAYGDRDPVGDFGKGVQRVYRQMQNAGMTHITFQQYCNARHDLLHEQAGGTAELVCHGIADWLAELI